MTICCILIFYYSTISLILILIRICICIRISLFIHTKQVTISILLPIITMFQNAFYFVIHRRNGHLILPTRWEVLFSSYYKRTALSKSKVMYVINTFYDILISFIH